MTGKYIKTPYYSKKNAKSVHQGVLLEDINKRFDKDALFRDDLLKWAEVRLKEK